MKTVLIPAGVCLALILSLLISGCGYLPAGEKPAAAVPAPPPKKQLYPVRVEPVKVQSAEYQLRAIGSVEAKDTYRIDARVPGTIYDVDFNEGDAVNPDKVLLRIAPEAYKFYALKAKALYDQAVGELADFKRKAANDIERKKIQLLSATLEISRRKPIQQAGAISEEEIQLYESKRDLADVELKDAKDVVATQTRVLEGVIAQRDAELKIAEDDVRKSTVLPPISGVIEKRFVTNQMYVTAGMPLATIVDTRSLRLVFKVSEKDSAAVKKDELVRFKVPAYPDREFEAKIYYLGRQLEAESRVAICYAQVTNDAQLLTPGYFASVKIVTNSIAKAVVAPATAILPSEQGFVAYVVKDGRAEKRILKMGQNLSNSEMEILSGLSEGESLVVEGANSLQPGGEVRVIADTETLVKNLKMPTTSTEPILNADKKADASGNTEKKPDAEKGKAP